MWLREARVGKCTVRPLWLYKKYARTAKNAAIFLKNTKDLNRHLDRFRNLKRSCCTPTGIHGTRGGVCCEVRDGHRRTWWRQSVRSSRLSAAENWTAAPPAWQLGGRQRGQPRPFRSSRWSGRTSDSEREGWRSWPSFASPPACELLAWIRLCLAARCSLMRSLLCWLTAIWRALRIRLRQVNTLAHHVQLCRPDRPAHRLQLCGDRGSGSSRPSLEPLA